MRTTPLIMLTCVCLVAGCQTGLTESSQPPLSEPERAFHEASQLEWHEVLSDPGTGDWTDHWFLDGKKAQVINSREGITLHAGPTPGEDASHAVLWTKRSFSGPIKIEYDYTRLDQSGHGVNILYLLATGSGEAPYARDIAEWRDLRDVPTMGKYFRNMHLYHISYAAATYDQATQAPTGNDYVRARRYMPDGRTLRGTNMEPDYRGTGLFRQGVRHHIVVIKHNDWLLMEVRNPEQRQLFAFNTAGFPEVREGRVGFRQMFTRSARYSNIKISQSDPDRTAPNTSSDRAD